jgi:hypothetical protein
MKVFCFILLIVLSCNLNIAAGEIDDYFEKCRQSGRGDYAAETQILENHTLEELAEALTVFFRDTTLIVRQQACYLIYKKGIQTTTSSRKIAVNCLTKGLNDVNGGLVGLLIEYLQNFSPADFDAESQSLILDNLKKIKRPHYEDLVLLAGFTGVGRDELYRQYSTPDLPIRKKWNIALALARMGDKESLDYCIQKVKQAPVNSNLVGYVLPNLIYIRQKAALDYCVELLYSDEKLCSSPNPDCSESILCAYRIIELLAPAIIDFPLEVNPAIGLESDDYPKTLQTVRDWFRTNPDYQIKTDIY